MQRSILCCLIPSAGLQHSSRLIAERFPLAQTVFGQDVRAVPVRIADEVLHTKSCPFPKVRARVDWYNWATRHEGWEGRMFAAASASEEEDQMTDVAVFRSGISKEITAIEHIVFVPGTTLHDVISELHLCNGRVLTACWLVGGSKSRQLLWSDSDGFAIGVWDRVPLAQALGSSGVTFILSAEYNL